jgi:hypothetical protein
MQQPPALIEGVVVDTADPQEMGRMKVWCPAIDGDTPNLETLPWVQFVTPFAGQTQNYPAGGTAAAASGPVSYGFWAVPKVGATVLIGFLYNDWNQRVYMGSMFRDHGNRSLPVGRNSSGSAPQSDAYGVIEPAYTNMAVQFQGKFSDSRAQTRGAYERQAAQAADEKDDSEGYRARVGEAGDPKAGQLDPQTYCITTPGRHSIIMQDNPQNGRLRIKTAEGHQIIFDDANERIYVSTSRGKSWIEMDVDGHIHMYGAASISVTSGADLNFSAKGNVNFDAGGNVNIAATGYARISACKDISFSGDTGVNLTSGAMMNLLATGNIFMTAPVINQNGPPATPAECADFPPPIVPTHEPWTRPATTGTRNKNWKA